MVPYSSRWKFSGFSDSSVRVLRKATRARWSASLKGTPPSGCLKARLGSKGGAACWTPVAVVLQHFLERREAAIVHVGRGEFDVAQRGHGEFAAVAFALGDLVAALVLKIRVEAVVGEGLALEQRAAVVQSWKQSVANCSPRRGSYSVWKQLEAGARCSSAVSLVSLPRCTRSNPWNRAKPAREQKLFDGRRATRSA